MSMIFRISTFDHAFTCASMVDIGRKRTTNQDEIISCPEVGFFAVADGMGGLPYGGNTSQMIAKTLPGIIQKALHDYRKKPAPEYAAKLLEEHIGTLSDTIYNTGNKDSSQMNFGATLSGVWLLGSNAIFVNLGDSRGYILSRYKHKIRQITSDHSVAAILVQLGEITKEEARMHPASSRLTRYIGMPAPALPDVFICEVSKGDRILLCSDGLHGMVTDVALTTLFRSLINPARVCRRLVEEANANGGRDNISVVSISIWSDV